MSYLLKDVYGMYKCNIEGGICFLGAKTLIGEEVIGKNGKKLGEIQELMIDMKNQKVAYALMSFAGFLGMGERLFAVPFDEEKFNTAPYIDPNDWPDMADKNWIREVHAFYGVEPYLMGM